MQLTLTVLVSSLDGDRTDGLQLVLWEISSQ